MKIRLVGAKLFHAEGHIDRHDEANRLFSKFCKVAYKQTNNKITTPLRNFTHYLTEIITISLSFQINPKTNTRAKVDKGHLEEHE
jgi:hypothetical protein